MNKREELFKIAREKIVISDPDLILSSLFIPFEPLKNGNQYKFRLRDEKTPSAYISIKNGEWRYTDFGEAGSYGSVIDIVMRVLNIEFYDAMLYCLRHLGFAELADEIENFDTSKKHIQKDELEERINELKEKNKLLLSKNSNKEKSSQVISKVVNYYHAASHKKSVAYLKNRGILKIPEEFNIIFGEYEKEGKTHKRFGVGVLTNSGGADIHFLETFGSLKTMTFGENDISYFKRTNTPTEAPILIFESKMDYAAAYQQLKLDNCNVIIANGAANYFLIADLIKSNNLKGKIFFMNQNDYPGYSFIFKLAEKLEIPLEKEIYIIHYHLIKEYKEDINDLLLKGVNIKSRIRKLPLKKIEEAIEFYKKNKDRFKINISA